MVIANTTTLSTNIMNTDNWYKKIALRGRKESGEFLMVFVVTGCGLIDGDKLDAITKALRTSWWRFEIILYVRPICYMYGWCFINHEKLKPRKPFEHEPESKVDRGPTKAGLCLHIRSTLGVYPTTIHTMWLHFHFLELHIFYYLLKWSLFS